MKRLDHYWYSINIISVILLPLSGLFCLLSLVRRLLYKSAVLQSYQAPIPVIVVGNISVGGTGKTPLIIELAKVIKSKGKKPGIISRGYGARADSWPQIVSGSSTADLVGDEPLLIFETTGFPVVVGPDRRQDIELLIEKFDCDVILSDDGMQHYKLNRDIEIAVIDAKRMFGNGLCIPSGPLRERTTRLKQVDIVLYNGGNEDQAAFTLQAAECIALNDENSLTASLDSFSGKTVHAVAGIGNPQRFFTMLEKHDITVIRHAFSDHYYFNLSDLEFSDELPVLMTEKDAVKCKQFDLSNHWSVPVELVLTSKAQTEIQTVLDNIRYKD